jgi:hypothetical protein
LLLGTATKAADSPAPSQELTVAQYLSELRTASNVLNGKDVDAIRKVRLALPSAWIVRTRSQRFEVQTDWLATALLMEEKDPKANAQQLQEHRQHLAALIETAEELAAPDTGPDLQGSHAKAERILSAPEFQGSHEPSWLDKLKGKIRDWISSQLEKLFSRLGVPASVGNVIAWILLVLVGGLLALWTVRALIARVSRAEMDLRGAVPAGKDWRYWAAEARSAAARGDYRSAIHAVYWASVAQLEESSELPIDRSRTPRESLRLMPQAKPVFAPFSDLTRRFEMTWYGYYPATEGDWNEAMQKLESIRCQSSSMAATADS